jgi:hypothetical protein
MKARSTTHLVLVREPEPHHFEADWMLMQARNTVSFAIIGIYALAFVASLGLIALAIASW